MPGPVSSAGKGAQGHNPLIPSWLIEEKESRQIFKQYAYCVPTSPIRQSEEFKNILKQRDAEFALYEVAERLWMEHLHNKPLYERYNKIAHTHSSEVMRLDKILTQLLTIDLTLYPEFPKVQISEEAYEQMLQDAKIQTRKEIKYEKGL